MELETEQKSTVERLRNSTDAKMGLDEEFDNAGLVDHFDVPEMAEKG